MGQLTIALDAMGGDAGAEMVVEGTAVAAKAIDDVNFLVFGDRDVLEPIIASRRGLSNRVKVRHTEFTIKEEDKPSSAVRRGRESSMGLAIGSVREGEAQVAVSAGNTGALMALSKVLLRTLPGIDRPALATLIPTRGSDTVMLDLGANVEGSVENLVQFAVMGAAFARTVFGLERPTVGLLNVGVEELKGHGIVKAAGRLLRETTLPLDFSGFIEGDGISSGVVDVLVTDGFTGNIAIKTAEGTAKLISAMLAEAFQSGLLSRLGYLLASPGLNTLRNHLDPNSHNGAVFLGLNGLVVKSHGGANPKGFATAIGVAERMGRADLCRLISDDLTNFGHRDQLEKKVVGVE